MPFTIDSDWAALDYFQASMCTGVRDNAGQARRGVALLTSEYPPQEPFTAIGAKYHDEVLRLGRDIAGIDLSYGDDPYQALTIVPAEQPNGDVFIALHGGGWTNGYKEWMLFMAPALTARGVTFVSAGYRLAPQHVFPSGYHDVLDAIALVHREIAKHGGDPERIFVSGHSAGGHLAALAALQTDWTATRGLPANVIRGSLPISGTYVFGPASGLSMRPRFLGPEENDGETNAAPTSYLHADAPPFLVAYGERDFPHLSAQAETFIADLKGLGVDVSEVVLADCDHLGASYESGNPDGVWVKTATRWMREH